MVQQCRAMTAGPLNVFPGMFRVNRWTPDFNLDSQKQSMMQVWLRIYDLLIEYRKLQTLFNIANGAGVPLKIDPRTLSLDIGISARALRLAHLSRFWTKY